MQAFIIHPLGPVYDSSSRILILGSLPSVNIRCGTSGGVSFHPSLFEELMERHTLVLMLFALFLPGECKTSESPEDGDIKTNVIPMPCVEWFINADVGIEKPDAEDPNVQLVMASHMGPGDVLVAISHMGRSKNVVELVKYARGRDITIISITNFPVSPLAKNTDILLLTAAFADHISGEVMSKRLAELCIIECLYVNTLLQNGKHLNPGVDVANEALELNIL